MMKRIAQNLLHRVYDSVTALVSVQGGCNVLDVLLFDTCFGMHDDLHSAPGADGICIICNHPEGSETLTKDEIMNCRKIIRQEAGLEASVYIYGEDIGLIEVDRNEILDYNGGNAS